MMTFVTSKKTVLGFLLCSLIVIFAIIGYIENRAAGDSMDAMVYKDEELTFLEGDSEEVQQTGEIKINVGQERSILEQDAQLQELSAEEFFIEYRLERDRTRSRQIELLQNIVNNPNSSESERKEAQKKILEISTTLEQELKLENLIKAKGYQDAALFIQPASVIVIVYAPNFDTNDATKISDLVSRTTGHKLEQITIMPKA